MTFELLMLFNMTAPVRSIDSFRILERDLIYLHAFCYLKGI